MNFLKMYANKGPSFGKSTSSHVDGLADDVASSWVKIKYTPTDSQGGYSKMDRQQVSASVINSLLHAVESASQGQVASTDVLYGDQMAGVPKPPVDRKPLNLPAIPEIPSFLLGMLTSSSHRRVITAASGGGWYHALAVAVRIFADLADNAKGELPPEKDGGEQEGEDQISLERGEEIELKRQPE